MDTQHLIPCRRILSQTLFWTRDIKYQSRVVVSSVKHFSGHTTFSPVSSYPQSIIVLDTRHLVPCRRILSQSLFWTHDIQSRVVVSSVNHCSGHTTFSPVSSYPQSIIVLDTRHLVPCRRILSQSLFWTHDIQSRVVVSSVNHCSGHTTFSPVSSYPQSNIVLDTRHLVPSRHMLNQTLFFSGHTTFSPVSSYPQSIIVLDTRHLVPCRRILSQSLFWTHDIQSRVVVSSVNHCSGHTTFSPVSSYPQSIIVLDTRYLVPCRRILSQSLFWTHDIQSRVVVSSVNHCSGHTTFRPESYPQSNIVLDTRHLVPSRHMLNQTLFFSGHTTFSPVSSYPQSIIVLDTRHLVPCRRILSQSLFWTHDIQSRVVVSSVNHCSGHTTFSPVSSYPQSIIVLDTRYLVPCRRILSQSLFWTHDIQSRVVVSSIKHCSGHTTFSPVSSYPQSNIVLDTRHFVPSRILNQTLFWTHDIQSRVVVSSIKHCFFWTHDIQSRVVVSSVNHCSGHTTFSPVSSYPQSIIVLDTRHLVPCRRILNQTLFWTYDIQSRVVVSSIKHCSGHTTFSPVSSYPQSNIVLDTRHLVPSRRILNQTLFWTYDIQSRVVVSSIKHCSGHTTFSPESSYPQANIVLDTRHLVPCRRILNQTLFWTHDIQSRVVVSSIKHCSGHTTFSPVSSYPQSNIVLDIRHLVPSRRILNQTLFWTYDIQSRVVVSSIKHCSGHTIFSPESSYPQSNIVLDTRHLVPCRRILNQTLYWTHDIQSRVVVSSIKHCSGHTTFSPESSYPQSNIVLDIRHLVPCRRILNQTLFWTYDIQSRVVVSSIKHCSGHTTFSPESSYPQSNIVLDIRHLVPWSRILNQTLFWTHDIQSRVVVSSIKHCSGHTIFSPVSSYPQSIIVLDTRHLVPCRRILNQTLFWTHDIQSRVVVSSIKHCSGHTTFSPVSSYPQSNIVLDTRHLVPCRRILNQTLFWTYDIQSRVVVSSIKHCSGHTTFSPVSSYPQANIVLDTRHLVPCRRILNQTLFWTYDIQSRVVVSSIKHCSGHTTFSPVSSYPQSNIVLDTRHLVPSRRILRQTLFWTHDIQSRVVVSSGKHCSGHTTFSPVSSYPQSNIVLDIRHLVPSRRILNQTLFFLDTRHLVPSRRILNQTLFWTHDIQSRVVVSSIKHCSGHTTFSPESSYPQSNIVLDTRHLVPSRRILNQTLFWTHDIQSRVVVSSIKHCYGHTIFSPQSSYPQSNIVLDIRHLVPCRRILNQTLFWTYDIQSRVVVSSIKHCSGHTTFSPQSSYPQSNIVLDIRHLVPCRRILNQTLFWTHDIQSRVVVSSIKHCSGHTTFSPVSSYPQSNIVLDTRHLVPSRRILNQTLFWTHDIQSRVVVSSIKHCSGHTTFSPVSSYPQANIVLDTRHLVPCRRILNETLFWTYDIQSRVVVSSIKHCSGHTTFSPVSSYPQANIVLDTRHLVPCRRILNETLFWTYDIQSRVVVSSIKHCSGHTTFSPVSSYPQSNIVLDTRHLVPCRRILRQTLFWTHDIQSRVVVSSIKHCS